MQKKKALRPSFADLLALGGGGGLSRSLDLVVHDDDLLDALGSLGDDHNVADLQISLLQILQLAVRVVGKQSRGVQVDIVDLAGTFQIGGVQLFVAQRRDL